MRNKDNIIGLRIKSARKAQGFTQRELGLQVRIDQAFLSRVENGTSELTPSQVNDLAQALGVSVAYLFGRDEKQAGLSEDAIELALRIQSLSTKQQRAVRDIIGAMRDES